ncbi:hypothetical protein QCA50_004673 [Cerrena zonata]|uniref:Uncharacterized protein n=1 Tax=Cerrena zonata TaxID=2478898 RepID=A0AAW0GJ91_9APHY
MAYGLDQRTRLGGGSHCMIPEVEPQMFPPSHRNPLVSHQAFQEQAEISALLLQLVQTSAHGVRLDAREIQKSRIQAATLRCEDSSKDVSSAPLLDKTEMEEIRLYISGLESATKAANNNATKTMALDHLGVIAARL